MQFKNIDSNINKATFYTTSLSEKKAIENVN